MRRLDDPRVLGALIQRFQRLAPDQPRVWGTMNAHQMASHVGDASEAVLKLRPFPSTRRRPRPVAKLLLLYVLPGFPRGVRTGANPAAKTLDTAAFAADRDRAITLLQRMVAAPREEFVEHHPILGSMNRKQWMRWAWLHTDHHLRQFGV